MKRTARSRRSTHGGGGAALVFAQVLVSTLAGCAWMDAGGGPAGPDAGAPGGGGAEANAPVVSATWPFWPTAMRIHPLTLVATDPDRGDPVIEARLEFLDDAGDTTKAIGQARLELYDRDPGDPAATRLETWSVDLRDLGRNEIHYDDITRTYLFRLELKSGTPADGAFLRAAFRSVDGREWIDAAEVG